MKYFLLAKEALLVLNSVQVSGVCSEVWLGISANWAGIHPLGTSLEAAQSSADPQGCAPELPQQI